MRSACCIKLLARAMPASRSPVREALRAMLEGRGGGGGRWEGGGSEETEGEVEKGRWRGIGGFHWDVARKRHLERIVAVWYLDVYESNPKDMHNIPARLAR